MDSGIKLTTKLGQALSLTPKLQQAIRLLQLNCQELQETVQQELIDNPILEEVKRKQSSEYDYEWRSKNGSNSDSSKYLEQTIATKTNLQSHLIEQLRLSEVNSIQEKIAQEVIGNLNSQGYLCSTPEEISLNCGCHIEEVKAVISLIQTLDPIGVAAQDLSECLMIQLDHIGLNDELPLRIIREHLNDLANSNLKKIADNQNVSIEQVKNAVNVIKRLDPYPGKVFGDETIDYAIPDVFIRKQGEDYIISVNNSVIPDLTLNKYYLNLITKNQIPREERSFINQKFQSANWLIKSIEQRQKTILDVTKSIVKFQKDFLDFGPAKLKPLILKDVADDLGIHESTVSRVTSNKFADTPQGLIPIKFFFSNALPGQNGEISAVSVRDRIKEIIQSENSKKPYSDQDISEILAKDNIKVARRTVAKYRESLGFNSTSARRQRD